MEQKATKETEPVLGGFCLGKENALALAVAVPAVCGGYGYNCFDLPSFAGFTAFSSRDVWSGTPIEIHHVRHPHPDDTIMQITRRSFLRSALATVTVAINSRALGQAGVTTAPIVTTQSGRVRGARADGVQVFKGIPYGASTAGPNRFRPPQPVTPWSGVRDALEFGAYPPQSNWTTTGPKQAKFWSCFEPAPNTSASEDCLNLNVWTTDRSGPPRSVMFWINASNDHGFANTRAYDGARLAREHDVVVVTANHRLGVLGGLFLGDVAKDFPATANAGALDLVAVLEWIRANIAAFGGDPSRVMIFGESGGGAKVAGLLGLPAATGLFHAAAMQSGGGPRLRWDRATATMQAETLLQTLGLKAGEAGRLRELSFEHVIAAANGISIWGPVLDGTVFPAHPFDPQATLLSADVPVILGRTGTETTSNDMDSPTFGELDEAGLIGLIPPGLRARAQEVIAMYRARMPKATLYELGTEIRTDVGAMDMFRVAERRAALGRAPTYVYFFDWETPVQRGLRAPHTMEIPFVLNNCELCPEMVGPVTPAMKRLETLVSRAWTALARTGKPTNSGLPAWPAYRAEARDVMRFNVETRIANDPGAEMRQLLQRA